MVKHKNKQINKFQLKLLLLGFSEKAMAFVKLQVTVQV